jgi:uncharacterized protein with PIN domain
MRFLPLPPARDRQQSRSIAGGGLQKEVYGCAADECAKLALQRCVRCQRPFCNSHVRAVERDLPTRGLRQAEPYWYCNDCWPGW